jgi:O-antigen/teichoic acid export membrane protein
MKQSIGLIILQFFGIAIGLITVFWVAGSIPAELFAIVGIQGIITSLVVVFSNTGLETHAIRNVLSWVDTDKHSRIEKIITQALVLRALTSFLVFMMMLIYSYYISKYKFNGDHFDLFIIMGFFSIFAALNDSIVLILKSFNRYFIAAFVKFSVTVFGRFFALLLFIKYGFSAYIYTIIVLPFIVTLPIIFMIKKWIVFKNNLTIEDIKKNLSVSKSFTFSSYISYLFNYFDQLFVSIFLSPQILGSFTLAKKIFLIGKTFLENIFDPMAQSLVRYKKKKDLFIEKLKIIFLIRNILLIISLICLPIVLIFSNNFINLLNLNHYPYLIYFINAIYIGLIVIILLKLYYLLICLFHEPRYYFILTLTNAIMSICFFLLLVIYNIKFVFFYIAINTLFLLFITSYIYNRDKDLMLRN